jgi:glutathionylspermidine synthase
MRREKRAPRPDLKSRIEKLGFSFHTVSGQPYWNETACYEFTAREVSLLESATNELHEMCLEAVAYVLKEKRLADFGIPQRAHGAIQRSFRSNPPTLYGRFDLAYDGEGCLKLLEYNADTPTSLLESAVIQWHWLQDIDPELDQFNAIWDRLIETWSCYKAGLELKSNRVHFACVDCDEDRMTTAVMMDTAQEAGLEISFLYMGEIGWHPVERCFVDRGHQPIKTIFKLYPWEWLLADKFGIRALKHLHDVQWIEPIWKMVLSNKAILAVLWEIFPNHPYLLAAYLDGPRDMQAYVRKPLLGREGANVTIYDGERSIAVDGPYTEGPFVYQAYQPLPVIDGNHVLIGSWTVNGHSCGMGIRESNGPITEDLARFVPHYFKPEPRTTTMMNVAVYPIAPMRIAMMLHYGSYDQISPVFDRLFEWVASQNVPVTRTIGIYWDNPDYVPLTNSDPPPVWKYPKALPLQIQMASRSKRERSQAENMRLPATSALTKVSGPFGVTLPTTLNKP